MDNITQTPAAKPLHRIRNFTPHPVVVTRDGGTPLVFASEGSVRLPEEIRVVGALDLDDGPNVPLLDVTRTEGDLPERKPGVFLVVSDMVRQAFPERKDLLSPTSMVRDGAGRITSCRAFASNLLAPTLPY